jgi:twitching motility protein PilT
MTALFSGTPLDGLLRIVTDQGGDRLSFKTAQEPVASVGTRALRLTVPATSNSMLRALCGGMAHAHANSGQRESHFGYDGKALGLFDVKIQGDLGDAGTASVLVSRRLAPRSVHATPHEGPLEDAALAEAATASLNIALPSRDTREPSPMVSSQLAPELLTWIQKAQQLGASDLHLTEGEPPVFRVAGRLQSLEGQVAGLRSLLNERQWAQVNAGRAVDLAFNAEPDCRARVNVFVAEQGLCAAIRLLRRQAPALESLGLPSEVHALARATQGLVLVCGPTGSGKSTTLAALTMSSLRDRPALCLTLESPIEYLLSGAGGHSLVRQREVGLHVDHFATGLRDALREDPDALLIGEMRDAETTALALTAAETGHLVLSSLHARSAVAAIDRIIDLYPSAQQRQARGQLAASLRAVVSQRLLPTKSGTSRVVATEVLTNVTAVAHLIREGKTEQIPSVIQSSKEAGMLPLERDLARLVQNGQVQRATARAHALVPEFFDQLCAAK